MLYPLIFKLKEKGIKNFIWIGWPGYFPDSEEEKQRIKILLNQHQCNPIWFTREQILKFSVFYYEHLDPLFHNFKGTDDNDIDESNQELWWTY